MTVPASEVLRVARGYIGVHEKTGHNDDSGDGRLHHIQSTTGAYNAAWCASFVQTVLKESGAGEYADDSAGVFYIRDYAQRHGNMVAAPAPGRLVIFNEGEGHIGIVETVNGDGTYNTIEGNHDNQCMRVRRVLGANHNIFVQLPTVTLTPPLITPAFSEWVDWKEGEGRFAGKGKASASARPKTWKPAVPLSYFTKLPDEIARRHPKPKPAPAPAPKPKPANPFLPKNGVLPAWYAAWATWKKTGQAARKPRPKSAPRFIPLWAWKRLSYELKG